MQAKLEAKNKLGMDTNYIKKQRATNKKGPRTAVLKNRKRFLKLQSCSYENIIDCLDGSFKVGILHTKDDV